MKVLLFVVALVALCRAEAEQRIVNGETATYGEHPYICSLQSRFLGIFPFSHICGCVIYNARTMVTAAHCLSGSAGSMRVVCGTHRMSQDDLHQQTVGVRSYTNHPSFVNNGTLGFPNDIAVVELSADLSFDSHVQAAIFATDSDGDFTGETCTLSGWGLLNGGGASATILQKVDMPAISNEDCVNRWSPEQISGGSLCFLSADKSACNGDSGGPVRCGEILAGVTSWGLSNCDGSRPTVYSRISYFSAWIASQAS